MEETNATQHGTEAKLAVSETSILLARFIEAHADSLIGILRSYVYQYGGASTKDEIQEAALELLHEVYIEANKTSAHFDPTRSPRGWILGIATNLLIHKRSKRVQRHQHETLLSEFPQNNQTSSSSNEDVLDRLSTFYGRGFEEEVEMREEVAYLFSLISEKDRYILELSYVQGLDGDALAQELDCSYTAAQTRLCRARQRLRAATAKQEGESHE